METELIVALVALVVLSVGALSLTIKLVSNGLKIRVISILEILKDIKDKTFNLNVKYDPVPTAEKTTFHHPSLMNTSCKHAWEVVDKSELSVTGKSKIVVVQKCSFCGLIDKTIEEVIADKPPAPILPVGECRHDWTKTKDVVLESAYEQMMEAFKESRKSTISSSNQRFTKKEKDSKQFLPDPDQHEPWMFKKTHIRERECKNCGLVDRSVVSSVDGPVTEDIVENENE